MKSVVCVEPGKLIVEERSEPEARNDWVKLRVKRVGICGTDFHTYEGLHPFTKYPRVMGHELSGEVIEAPEGAKLAVGEQVIVNPYLPCGKCVACRKAKPNCCVNIKVLGVHTDGGMCETIYVPEEALYPTEGLSLSDAAMVEFLSVGAHGVRRGEVRPGDKVLVVGVGPIGLGAALFAALIEGTKVAILDVDEERVSGAVELVDGATGFMVGQNTQSDFESFTYGDMFDVVLDATGNKTAMETSIGYAAHGGSCVFISVVKGDITLSDPLFHSRELRLIGSRNATREDFEHVISCIKAGLIPTERLNTHEVDLHDLPNKFPEWLENNRGLIKAIVNI